MALMEPSASKAEKELPEIPRMSQEDFDKLTPAEQYEFLTRQAIASVGRYGGRPDLLIKENPELDLRRFEKK
jgi:hypothetical protein